MYTCKIKSVLNYIFSPRCSNVLTGVNMVKDITDLFVAT